MLRAHGVRVRIGHVLRALAGTAAGAAQALARLGPHAEPPLTRYAVDQLAHSVVLDVSKARARGWTARRTLADYTAGGTRT